MKNIILLLAIFIFPSPPASAQIMRDNTITHFHTVTYATTVGSNWRQVFTIPQFDPLSVPVKPGETVRLVDVESFTYWGTRHWLGVECLGGPADTAATQCPNLAAILDFKRVGYKDGAYQTTAFAYAGMSLLARGPFDGKADYVGQSGMWTGVILTYSDERWVSIPDGEINQFIGTGTVDMQVDAVSAATIYGQGFGVAEISHSGAVRTAMRYVYEIVSAS